VINFQRDLTLFSNNQLPKSSRHLRHHIRTVRHSKDSDAIPKYIPVNLTLPKLHSYDVAFPEIGVAELYASGLTALPSVRRRMSSARLGSLKSRKSWFVLWKTIAFSHRETGFAALEH